ncbi:MAG: hypothetical protein ACOC35_07705 [Promethearchaeia archaeon]
MGGIIFILALIDFTLPNDDYFPALLLLTILAALLLIFSFFLKDQSPEDILISFFFPNYYLLDFPSSNGYGYHCKQNSIFGTFFLIKLEQI